MMTKKITTMVCVHDLLGYGDMISVSGGTLDSAVGKIAYERIKVLRKTLGEIKVSFPGDTVFFQLNDAAVAVCDLKHEIGSMHVDPMSIYSEIPSPESAIKVLIFFCGSSQLHHRTIENDQEEKIGSTGRTFIVLGERWPIEENNDGIIGVPELQTNLAYAEAYLADLQGSRAGFDNRIWENIYVNDQMWFLLCTLRSSILQEFDLLENKILPRSGDRFPNNLLNDTKDVIIFNRRRKFYSIASHHAIDINKYITPTT